MSAPRDRIAILRGAQERTLRFAQGKLDKNSLASVYHWWYTYSVFPFLMPTTKDRIQVTLPKDVAVFLRKLSKRDHVAPATKALLLIKSAMEIDEDIVFDRLATAREAEPDSVYLSHKDVWR